MVTPYLIAPRWCMNYIRNDPNLELAWGTLDCDAAAEAQGIYYSGIISLSPLDTALMDIFCISYLLFHRLYKTCQGKFDKRADTIRSVVICVLAAISIGSSIYAIFNRSYPELTNLIRPIIIILYFRSIRNSIKHIMASLMDSMVILASFFIFMTVYILVGYSFFRAENMGMTTFPTLNSTMYSLIVLITTCNFPDVMLPAYDQYFWNSLYFISFMIVGFYLILNLLLANIFSVYQRRLGQKTDERAHDRLKIILAKFDSCDEAYPQKKKYLTENEARRFLYFVMSFDKEAKRDFIRYNKLKALLDPAGTG